MLESTLVITIFITAVFTPVLIPAAVHAIHFARDGGPVRPVRVIRRLRRPLPLLSRRVAAPAMG